MTARAYEIEPHLRHDGWQQGFNGPTYEAFWLHTSGQGHWVQGGRRAGRFHTETDAHAHGRFWVETGRDVSSEQGGAMFAEWLRNDPGKVMGVVEQTEERDAA